MIKRNTLLASAALLASALIFSCKKSDNKNGALTVANLSGSYKLKALVWVSGNVSVNVYDSLPACEKDDIIKLNPDLSANFIDAGVRCTPPGDATGTWKLSGDSLYIGANAGKISSFDGTTLVITGHPGNNGVPGVQITSTTTLIKQ